MNPDAEKQREYEDSPYREEILAPERIRLWRDKFRRLCLRVDGEREFLDVRAAASFPVSGRSQLVSFLGDREREVALVRDPLRLDPESRALLVEELARAYFRPRITCIYRIDETFGSSRWEVETDRGFTILEVADREQIRLLPEGRIIVQDVDGNRFEIPDVTRLDPASQALIDSET
jgi:hypothetical protein